ncbi:MAG: hypothetical protein IT545_11955 [Rhodobacteraceae bacterium]|nr:hypothetical protein [Paracoccaceae bacterium]
MLTRVGRFLNDDAGAVTVDWVILCAAMVGLGVLVVTFIGDATSNLSTSTGGYIGAITVGFASE